MTPTTPHVSTSNPDAPRNAAIEAVDLTRRFGNVTALDHVSLTIQEGEFFSLLGPSGCGKTTLLRIIAGLETLDAGTLRICGTDANNIAAHQRPVNTVFQNYALFPHLNVWDNIAFGLRMKKVAHTEIKSRMAAALNLVEIADLAQRKPHQISGGQKQRVALARAIINEPKVLLLDEPLGALDLKLRKQLQIQLHQLQRRVGITFIYVTHDQEEALVMSDRVAVMNAGRIEQLATAETIYENPRTRFVAEFLGACNIISGVVKEKATGRGVVETEMGVVVVGAEIAQTVGAKVSLAIRPEKIILEPTDTHPTGSNRFTAEITDKIYSGAETQVRLRFGAQIFTAIQLNSNRRADLAVGQSVAVCMPKEALVVLQD